MIARYKRMSRTLAELDLGELAPLHEAIPELSIGHGLTTGQKKGASQFPEKRRDSVAGARYGTWTKAITVPFRVELAA